MALSVGFARAHIMGWQQTLSLQYYRYRSNWPRYLFHHSPLQNAVSILRSGQLCSRNDPTNPHPIDVAAAGVIDASHAAHDFVRIYFRPCTPTQYHIEGIRKPGEGRYGDASHAPVLVMFVLDAEAILTRAGTQFSDRNMQIPGTVYNPTEAHFSTIPFEKVYHIGGIGGDHSIVQHRCAEVLAVSPLRLDEALQWVYCRSEAERELLLFELRGAPVNWADRIKVSDDLKVFQREYTFVEEVRLSSDGVIFQLNPRLDGRNVSIDLRITAMNGRVVASLVNSDFAPRPPTVLQW
ncbi:DarT ssDNA thymidine ADP-ribosyltransferase family protein [Rhizobium sp. KDH_Rht_773_N]